MQGKKTVGFVKIFSDGGVLFFKVWTLQAYDNSNNLICEVTQKESNNFIKYVKFIKKIRESGYELTKQQIEQIRAEPFLMASLFDMITLEHIYEVAEICGYTKDDVNQIPSKSQEEKEIFFNDLGFFPDEIVQVINKLKSKI